MPRQHQLSRRERQIMDLVYAAGEITAAEVLEQLPDPPSYSAVRSAMRLLEDKGHLRHRQEGPRYIYTATVPRGRASRSALRHVLDTFFDGSTEAAVAALLDLNRQGLSEQELKRIRAMIEQARREGR